MKLQQLQIFQNLTEEELEKSLVCSQAVVKKYPKDTYIFLQGDVPLKLYFILEGMVELGSINLNGKITRSSYVTVGGWFSLFFEFVFCFFNIFYLHVISPFFVIYYLSAFHRTPNLSPNVAIA